jgi:formylglycine-generating enzyme required for sulfatase activity
MPEIMVDSDLFLFVSHVSEDRAVALEIVSELERRGVPCWIAPRNVEPGKPFDDEISDALDRCRAMLLIFSEHCNESEYIRREITVAGESHKIIIPFRIEDVLPRRGLRVRLSDLHWIDGFASRERAVDELAKRFDPSAASKDERQVAEQHQRADEARKREEEARQVEKARKAEAVPHVDRRFARNPAVIGIGIAVAVLVTFLGLILSGVFSTSPSQQASTAPSASGPQPTRGQSFRDCPDCPEMVAVPPGQFMMGSDASDPDHLPSEALRHAVTVAATFAVGKYDVTRAEYATFMQATGRTIPISCPGTDRDPVVCVTLDDTHAYAAWLSKTTGKEYRLLTEAEWEYAARAGTATIRYWGDGIGFGHANCNGCGGNWDGKGISPVGSLPPNPWGLYDMLGTAMQFVEDCWHDNYVGAPSDASAWVSGDCISHVTRGGAFFLYAKTVRASARSSDTLSMRINYLGFRVARTITP